MYYICVIPSQIYKNTVKIQCISNLKYFIEYIRPFIVIIGCKISKNYLGIRSSSVIVTT